MGAEAQEQAGASPPTPATFEMGLVVCRRYLETRVGLAPGTYVFANGSGLNDVNRFTARQIAQILRTAMIDYEIGSEFVSSLAVAGTQGTIGNRMKDMPALRRLRAKTGTLFGVSALSGSVVEPDGNVVVFAVLMQGLRDSPRAAQDAQTLIGNSFASGGIWRKKGNAPVENEAVSQVTPTMASGIPGG
jgi:PBP4 family serine-type D-alanyl-D-alanine carboxypeptidase